MDLWVEAPAAKSDDLDLVLGPLLVEGENQPPQLSTSCTHLHTHTYTKLKTKFYVGQEHL